MRTLLLKSVTVATMLSLAVAGPALAQCSLSGDMAYEMTTDPMLPAYQYTLTVMWDMDSPYGLSHLDLVVDLPGGTCGCEAFDEAIFFDAIAGSSDGEGGCSVDYAANLECSGDPSIPGVDGILFKFEPMEGMGCEPGPVGTGIFVFYSDLAPVPVDEEFAALVDKAGLQSCTGSLTGVFPGMACDPVPTESSTFDGIKSFYR